MRSGLRTPRPVVHSGSLRAREAPESSDNHRHGATSSDQRVILVFDPPTGAFLDVEMILLEAGEWPISAPATRSYTVWLSAGYTPTTQHRP